MYRVAHARCEEYEGTYRKKFGLDQNRGVREEVARHQYKDVFDDWMSRGILQRKFVGGHAYISLHEVVAGVQVGTASGCKYKKQRSSSNAEMQDAKSVMEGLAWFWQIPDAKALMDGCITKSMDKLKEAIDAHAKIFKQAVDMKQQLAKAPGPTLLYITLHYVTLHYIT